MAGGSLLSKYSYKKLSQNETEQASIESEDERGETEMSESCDSATQYSTMDLVTSSDILPHYHFSLELPVTLREEDCEWDDEDVTCNVCDRSFATPVHLESHMIKHRHWLCSLCDKLFNSSCELEYHKAGSTPAWISLMRIIIPGVCRTLERGVRVGRQQRVGGLSAWSNYHPQYNRARDCIWSNG